MAIIHCPSCDQRISSKATTCEFCKTRFDESEDAERLERQIANKRFNKRQRLQNLSFLFVMLFAAGALLMYFGINDEDQLRAMVGKGLLVGGFIGYLLMRVLLILHKRS